jgi:hypothetical protein
MHWRDELGMGNTMGQKMTLRATVAKRFGFLSALDTAFGMVSGTSGDRASSVEERLLQRAANDAAQR